MKWETEAKPEWQEYPKDPLVREWDWLLNDPNAVKRYRQKRADRLGVKSVNYGQRLRDFGGWLIVKFEDFSKSTGAKSIPGINLKSWE